jgi:hypothetical protein
VIIGCSVAALAGGAGIDTAYALGGGGFEAAAAEWPTWAAAT